MSFRFSIVPPGQHAEQGMNQQRDQKPSTRLGNAVQPNSSLCLINGINNNRLHRGIDITIKTAEQGQTTNKLQAANVSTKVADAIRCIDFNNLQWQVGGWAGAGRYQLDNNTAWNHVGESYNNKSTSYHLVRLLSEEFTSRLKHTQKTNSTWDIAEPKWSIQKTERQTERKKTQANKKMMIQM